MNRVDRNLPYTEEAQHVVDAISIKELRHILESASPPLTVVLQHLVPVVGREAPVLTIHREVIRWSSSLSVKIEVLRLCPHITAKTVHTDRNVAFQNDSLGHGMLVGSLHLCVQHKLNEVEELHLLVGLCSWVGQCLAVFLVPSIVVGPLREISSAILIAQTRILCIRHQPLFCFLEECLIFGTLHHLFTFLIEDLVQVRYLEIIYLFIIYLGQGIEFCSCLLSLSTSLGILKLGQSLQVGILWVNGKHADTAVGIRVCPGVSDGRIVDRQQLKHLLSSLCHQVDHTLQVSKVAYTCTLLAAKREDRNQYSGKLTVPALQERLAQLVRDYRTGLHLRYLNTAVVTCFPCFRTLLVVQCYKLKLQVVDSQSLGIDIHRPFVVRLFHHRHGTLYVPGSYKRIRTYQYQALTFSQLWSTDYQSDGLGKGIILHLCRLLMVDTVGEGAAVEVRILRNVTPVIIDGIIIGTLGCHIQLMLHHLPFLLDTNAITFYTIIIGNVFSLGSHIQIARPVKPVCSSQAVMNLFVVHVQVQDEILAINRFVFYIKTKHHKEL